MSFLMVTGGLMAALFLLSYLRAGRLGSTILALGAGYVLALTWTDALAAREGISLLGFSWRDTVFGLLILVPGVLVLLCGPKQQSIVPRIVAALVVAVLGAALLLPILGIGHDGYELYTLSMQYRDMIVSGLLLLGLLDVIISRLPKAPKHKDH